MAADKTIKQLLDHVEKAIASFQKGVPVIQTGVLDSLQSQLKDLETREGKVLNSVQNLKLIAAIKNKLERLIISEGYKDNVKEFIKAFDTVDLLQNQYFAAFNKKFKPSKTLPIIKSQTIDTTLNGLLGQGLGVNIVDRIGGILKDSVTTGGSYASLTEQLREHIIKTETEGSLERYTKTITTDAINQYSAQYHETIAQDLQFNWGRYVGSNITTTREFCDRLTAKEWVHRSELPAIVKGEIDGQTCKLSKSTGLPLGMIPGTDAANFKIRRGGYNCGHQFFWVPDSAVPENVKNNIGKAAEQKKKYDIEILNRGGFDKIRNDQPRMKKLAKIKSKLSIDERIAINGYSDNEFYVLNKYLRGNYTGKNAEYFKNYKEILNDALDKIWPPVEKNVFRGTNLSSTEINKYREAFKKDGIIKEDAFVSTSEFISSAFGGNVRFFIKSKTGKSIRAYSEIPGEEEILFRAGLSYRVLNIDEKDGITYIKMEEL